MAYASPSRLDASTGEAGASGAKRAGDSSRHSTGPAKAGSPARSFAWVSSTGAFASSSMKDRRGAG
ncbi:hypothetical protein COSO111634_22065 [Corallococcus soli]